MMRAEPPNRLCGQGGDSVDIYDSVTGRSTFMPAPVSALVTPCGAPRGQSHDLWWHTPMTDKTGVGR